ncbi:MAG TPA: class I SAM-dependent methyltransferase [Candidatus Bathyarchaeia archaeon]|nr:class I SAM-dependent methyltransferase [Candidatus Bathyarchaeia archaeon]
MSWGRDRLFGGILDLIEKKRGTGRLLDIGCGCGVFLEAAQKSGWKVKGIEPSIQSVEVAKRQYGLDVFTGTLQEHDENGKFDVITLINVLDHSVEPWKEINKANLLLKPGGTLYLRFPNGFFHSFLFNVSKKLSIERSITRFLVFHEYCFTPGFIRRLLSDHGFTDIQIYNASLSGGSLISSFPVFSFVARVIEAVEKLTDSFSGGRVLWGPSLEVIAGKR